MTTGTGPPTRLSDLLDLDVALHRVQQNSARDSFPNHIDPALIHEFPKEFRDRVAGLLDDATFDWANGSLQIYDLPRSDGLVRPIGYVDPDVRIVYQALVDAVALVIDPYVEDQLSDRLLSHRIASPKSQRMFADQSKAYSQFIDVQHHHADGHQFSHCVRLDVSNYYERIYQHDLYQLIQQHAVLGAINDALATLLRKFSTGISYGIPQGLWPSDYLGSIYLIPLDEYFKNSDVFAIRYVDDYRIFCGSLREARTLLKDAAIVLRGLGLNANPLKTSIVEIEELQPELRPITEKYFALKQDRALPVHRVLYSYLGDVEFEGWDEQPASAPLEDADVQAFEDLWDEAVDQEEKRTMILNFALTGLSVSGSTSAEEFVLQTLADFPHIASAASRYLSALGFQPDTGAKLLDFIESSESIHEWQQMWLLEYFRTDAVVPRKLMGRIVRIARDGARHPLVRSAAADLIGIKGSPADGAEVRHLFTAESNPRLRRALLSGFRLLAKAERNHALAYLPPEDWNLQMVGKLVKSD